MTTPSAGSENSAPMHGAFCVILGVNEIASAVAVAMFRAGWQVVLSHDPYPPVVRRRMAFHDALYGEDVELSGVRAICADTSLQVRVVLKEGRDVAVTRLGLLDLIPIAAIEVLIDARLQKYETTPDLRHLAGLTVGLGPGFTVGQNCDLAVETHPAKTAAILSAGCTDMPDGKPRLLGGVGAERFAYSDAPGRWHSPVEIGTRVYKNFPVGLLNGVAIPSPIDGVLRGIVRDGTEVPARVKLFEIDPRGRRAKWAGIDARGKLIAEATLRGITGALARAHRKGALV